MRYIKTHIVNNTAFIILFISIIALYAANSLFASYVPVGGDILPIIFIAGLFLLSALATVLAEKTIFPSFLVAIFVGLALHDVLAPVTGNEALMNTIITVSAIYILFGGGIEIVFSEFKRIITPTILLSFVGLLISVFLLAMFLTSISFFATAGITVSMALLLGAILASTDPAAIIPVLKNLKFYKHKIKDIVVSESALTDVTGALVTFSFLYYLGAHGSFESLTEGASALISFSSLVFLVKEISVGISAGILGSVMLHFFLKRKRVSEEQSSDVALFIAIPLVAFGLAALFGGSGYLAAFTSGLLILIHEKVRQTESFFVNMTEGIAKPLIFIFLGAIVDVQALMDYALIGVIAGMLFICVVRPLSVFLTLWFVKRRCDLTTKELLFVSCVRETGVIPAVLLLHVLSMPALALGNAFVAVGMWIIVMTLVLLPPITPWIARKLDVAE